MSAERRFAEVEHLTAIARAAVGQRGPAGVERLRGGTKKGVYRLLFDDGSSVIVYSWDTDENYWPTRPDDESDDYADPFSPASGFDLFEAAHARLRTLGVRVPRVYLADRGRQIFPADVAVVEDVRGATLEVRLQEDPQASKGILARLGESLGMMHQCPAPTFGKVRLVDRGGCSRGGSCEEVVLKGAVDDLAEAASRDRRMAGARDELDEVLHNLAAEVRPRSRYGLIHGELGPDHVLVDGQGEPVLIDIEGLMYFDVEWEHVFLRLRFDEQYDVLRGRDLDEHRLRFYRLAMHISLVAKPLVILDGDFPDRRGMLEIAEHNLGQALTFLR